MFCKEMMSKYIFNSFGTHNGKFHADEVTACALLLLFRLIDRDKIERTRDASILKKCTYVCDVGGIYDESIKRFDHHQKDYTGSLSSAGMILNYLKNQHHISENAFNHLHHSLVDGVDKEDIGVLIEIPGVSTYSAIINNYNSISYEATKTVQDSAFFEAVDFALGHLKRTLDRLHYMESCREMVRQAMALNSDFLIFEVPIPWRELFFEMGGEQHPAQFVIMPSGDHFTLRGIPPSMKNRMDVRTPFPKEWAGLLTNELCAASGIKGAVFCHKGRFISVWETKEDALEAYQKMKDLT
jgi:uncharacterized UPF0160 family protein